MVSDILVDQINVSDDEYLLVELLVESGSKVRKDQHLLTYESSKSAFEFEANISGYVYFNPNLIIDESYKVGFKIGVISDSKLSNDDLAQIFDSKERVLEEVPSEIKFTKKAEKLFTKYKIDLSKLENLPIITEDHILKIIKEGGLSKNKEHNQIEAINPDLVLDDKTVIIYGTGSHATVALDTLISNSKYRVEAFVDYDVSQNKKEELPVISHEYFTDLIEKAIVKVYVCVPDQKKESELLDQINKSKSTNISIFSESAIISDKAIIGKNVFIGPNCIVGPHAKLHQGVRMLNNSSVAHHATIGSHTWISDGARVGGSVMVGKNCVIGLNSSINKKVIIGDGCIINSNVAVIENHDNGVYIKK